MWLVMLVYLDVHIFIHSFGHTLRRCVAALCLKTPFVFHSKVYSRKPSEGNCSCSAPVVPAHIFEADLLAPAAI